MGCYVQPSVVPTQDPGRGNILGVVNQDSPTPVGKRLSPVLCASESGGTLGVPTCESVGFSLSSPHRIW